MGSWNGANPAD